MCIYIYIEREIFIHMCVYIYIYIYIYSTSWVTGFSGKPACREIRGFAGWEKQPQSRGLGPANQQLAS